MPYPRYSGAPMGGSGVGGHGGYHTDPISPWQSSGVGGDGLLPTPHGRGGRGGGPDLNPVANILGSLLGGAQGGGALASLAGQLAVAQAAMSQPKPMGPTQPYPAPPMYPSREREFRDSRRRDRSPPRSSRGYGAPSSARRRTRSRSRDRRSRASSSRFSSEQRGNGPKARPAPAKEEDRERPEFEIYIGNYPKGFKDTDLKNLFKQNDVEVGIIRMKNDGMKAFAFAETKSKDEIDKAVKAMDSVEIRGRRLRVRAAGDKDPKPEPKDPKKAEPKVETKADTSHVKKHLIYAFNRFVNQEIESVTFSDENVEKLKLVQTTLKDVFEIPDDDSLQISRSLDMIFMQNNRREIPKPSEKKPNPEKLKPAEKKLPVKAKEAMETEIPKVEEKTKEGDDDGNWKRRGKSVKSDEEEEEEEEKPSEVVEEKEVPPVAEVSTPKEETTTATNENDVEMEDPSEETIGPKEDETPVEDEALVEEEIPGKDEAPVEDKAAAEDEAPAEEVEEIEAEAFPPVKKPLASPTRGGRGGGKARRSRGKQSGQ